MSQTKVANAAASARAGKPAQQGCTDCETFPDVKAVILYPSLGMPLVLAPGQKRCSIVIATDGAGNDAFGTVPLVFKDRVELFATSIHKAVDRHLRLHGIDKKVSSDVTKVGTLFGDGKSYARAQAAVTGHQLGMINEIGKRFVTRTYEDGQEDFCFSISPQAAALYRDTPFVYQVHLDLTAEPFQKINDSDFLTFAWMVERKATENLKGTHAHYNDVEIEKFRIAQKDHYPEWTEFKLDDKDALRKGMPSSQVGKDAVGIWSWHPVIRSKAAGQLKLGHLSDVHVNIRQNVLAQSPACVLENAKGTEGQKPVGDKVSHCLETLKDLFDQFGSGPTKADALVITGDLIDFNRNLTPNDVKVNIGEQWKAFNVVNNLTKDQDEKTVVRTYPRGQDDMLMFSLVRYAYTQLKLPVFLTTGNHEAYQVPYGISPRVKRFTRDGKRGVSEKAGLNFVEALKKLEPEDKEGLNDYVQTKANGGIAADHNMTIYEAVLAYGPTYAQVILTENFNATQFDWFYALFNPLNNWCVHYGVSPNQARQTLVGLGWGDRENYKNATLAGIQGHLLGLGSDKQGVGVLPRSVEGISRTQQEILQAAKAKKQQGKTKSLSVFSHFTLINYGPAAALTDRNAAIELNDAAFNQYNTGTCERNRKWYFAECVNQPGKAVDYHFSGHSHRAGVYQGKVQKRVTAVAGARAPGAIVEEQFFKVQHAFEPALKTGGTAPALLPRGNTALIVSNSGGPVGTQNYNHELNDGTDSWTMRPPSGTLLDPDAHTVHRVAVDTTKIKAAKPRLCVALDYVHLGKPDSLVFKPQSLSRNDNTPAQWAMQLSQQFLKLQCIKGVKFWIFATGDKASKDGNRQSENGATGWISISPAFAITAVGATVTFSPSDLQILKAVGVQQGQVTAVQPMFAELTLQAPATDWAKDMNCDDPWIFPVRLLVTQTSNSPMEAGKYLHSLRRPSGEQGEIPMWDWLRDTFGTKYPDALKDIIKATGKV